jgi:LmbE family N-acetylglucosaminyl deacetylase
MSTETSPRIRPRLKSVLRGLLRTSLLSLCRLRSRPYLPDAGPMLIIAPHQDDCTLGCGGLIFKKRLAGQPVDILYLTDGSASHLGHPLLIPAEISTRRKNEARLAHQRLGVDATSLFFLDLPDSRLGKLDTLERADAVTRLAAALAVRAPSTLLLPLRYDGSSEHQAGFTLVRDALDRASIRPRFLEYPVWSLWSARLLLPTLGRARIYRFDFPEYAPKKIHALDAYVSQFEPTPPWDTPVLPDDFFQVFAGSREFFWEYKL